MKNLVTLFSLFFLLCSVAIGQTTVKSLEQKRSELEKEIAYTNSLIEKTSEQVQSNMDNYSLIQSNIQNRKQLLYNIDIQLNILNTEISAKRSRISNLNDELAILKDNYAKMLIFTYNNRNSYTKMMYILASDNITQAYRRLSYLKSYSVYRLEKAANITSQTTNLNNEVSILKVKQVEQEQLQKSKTSELLTLDAEEKQLQGLLASLQNRQRELKRELDKKIKEARAIDKEIEKLIAEEAKREQERRKQAEKKNKASANKMVENERVATRKFEALKGNLPMPVARGVVVTSFGIHDHSVLKGIKVTCNGVDISTTDRTPVVVVADGVVKKIFAAGASTNILVQHGLYYTVYTHVTGVRVADGDIVKAGQPIAVVSARSSNESPVLHFELWYKTEKQDPEKWFKK